MRANYRVSFRRRRDGKTNYRRRRALLRAGKLRVVVRHTLNKVIVQFITAKMGGDCVVSTATSDELKANYGWKAPGDNLPAAYLTGFLAGCKAKKAGFPTAILDVGVNKPPQGSRIYSTLKGVVDAGVDVPFTGELFPAEERIQGQHIAQYAQSLIDPEAKKRIFAQYLRSSLPPEELPKHFIEVKARIAKGYIS